MPAVMPASFSKATARAATSGAPADEAEAQRARHHQTRRHRARLRHDRDVTADFAPREPDRVEVDVRASGQDVGDLRPERRTVAFRRMYDILGCMPTIPGAVGFPLIVPPTPVANGVKTTSFGLLSLNGVPKNPQTTGPLVVGVTAGPA